MHERRSASGSSARSERRTSLAARSCGGMEVELLKLFKFDDLEDFFLRVGYGEISAQHISTKLASVLVEEQPDAIETIAPPARAPYTTNISVLGTGALRTRPALIRLQLLGVAREARAGS